jgi:DNA-binding NtrC family response regulator
MNCEVDMVMNKSKILLVEDDNSLRSSLGLFLEKNHCIVTEVESAEQGVSFLEKSIYDLVVTDLRLYGQDGLWLLRHIRKEFPDTPVILMSAYGDVEAAVEALKDGAADFITKPFTPPSFIERCNAALAAEPRGTDSAATQEVYKPVTFKGLVGRSFTVKKMKDMIRMLSIRPTNLLLSGESGTGKETTARKIHNAGPRKNAPFVVINCAALSEETLEKELFSGSGQGLFLSAEGGTIFFEEISAFSQSIQSRLLRVLETRKLRKPGKTSEDDLGVRFICSSSSDLEALVHDGQFREDLFYRINVVQLHLEPLRERIDDVPIFMEYFLKGFNQQHGTSITGFSKEVYSLFMRYEWPGNVRELRNVIERAVIFCNDALIEEGHIPESVRTPRRQRSDEASHDGVMTLRDMEKLKILETLRSFGGNRATTAKALGIGRNTLWRKLKEYEIEE